MKTPLIKLLTGLFCGAGSQPQSHAASPCAKADFARTKAVRVIEFVEVATETLDGVALMWAAMTADGWTCSNPRNNGYRTDYARSFDCENQKTRLGYQPGILIDGFAIIHKHAVTLEPSDPWVKYGNQWQAMCITHRDDAPHSFHTQHGPDPLIAGLRAFVGAMSGETVLIPSVLME